ncbi:hypothetical protein PVK06_030359 [Gossypium arboreum]|uniref:Uncharacterized protein n=1 Tax=Gossypium arboreum TaxID=29729 RepID=A0ABR0NN37_GOSAR|nr:hypothetical protein PVK06_030359 [Gossypium arboreum]
MEIATEKVWNNDLNVNSLRDLTMEDFNKGNKDGGTYAILKNENLKITEEDVRVLLEFSYPKIYFFDRVQEILDKNME